MTLLTPDQLVELLQIPKNTLYQWKHKGIGPQAIKIGKHLRYDLAEVVRFIESKKV